MAGNRQPNRSSTISAGKMNTPTRQKLSSHGILDSEEALENTGPTLAAHRH